VSCVEAGPNEEGQGMLLSKARQAVESPRFNARDSIRTMMVPSKALYNKSRKNTDHEREEKGGIEKRGAKCGEQQGCSAGTFLKAAETRHLHLKPRDSNRQLIP